jgi:hypothetical protein
LPCNFLVGRPGCFQGRRIDRAAHHHAAPAHAVLLRRRGIAKGQESREHHRRPQSAPEDGPDATGGKFFWHGLGGNFNSDHICLYPDPVSISAVTKQLY